MIKNHSFSIHKFGGSSLASAERFMAIKSLLQGNEIIVVSAISGTTNALQSMLDEAKSSLQYRNILAEQEKIHLLLAKKLALEKNNISRIIQADIVKIQDILYAIYLTGSYSKDIQHLILGYGELWSAMLLKEYLGLENKVSFLDAAKVLFTYVKDGLVVIDWKRSKAALDNYLKDTDFNQLVITGFIAATREGQRTTLGRNGSDFSAAIFANLFQAMDLTIWTDVDGIYTADPQQVPSALVIDALSYEEALELAYFGAKVLHPMTIAPVVEQQIPVYIRNSFNPQKKGTCISGQPDQSSWLIKGITCIKRTGLINIEGSGLISVSGISYRVFDILQRAEIKVLFISQASSEHSLCLAVPANSISKARDLLLETFQADIERKLINDIHIDTDCSIVSIVGDKMIGSVGISGKLCSALAKANINIRAISQGSSERNISLLINNTDVNKAMQAIHAGFYLSRKTLSIGLIGPGIVGQSLLAQLAETISELSHSCEINFYVRGIMNSRNMLLQDSAIDLCDWQTKFGTHAVAVDLERFIQHIASDNIPNAVIIDCTANQEISGCYAKFMEKGIHVITPNKHANAGDLACYRQLKSLAKNNNYYFYEATVCAGLPVISTLQDLIKTGDSIEEIEGVFSGTLSYIFNELAKGKPFSTVVLEARRLGFTEPDPREDLSGMDVARKLVGLAREAGHDVSLDEVFVHNLVPEELRSCSLDEFMARLADYDEKMNEWLLEAQAGKQQLYYAGTISKEGELKVAIKSVYAEHPFSRLEGTDNIIIFRTKRYNTRPLIIQGPGAGAEVTAAGIFSDLLRLASIL